jgi:hypothetical protein
MRQHLKAIIKQIVVEEMQKEGKGYLRGAVLAGLLALGGNKLIGSADKQEPLSQTQQVDTVQSLADFAVNNLKQDFEGMDQAQMQVIDQLESIENFQGSDDELFEKLRVLAVRLQRAGLVSSTVSEYMDRYRSLKATRSTR